MFKIFFELLKTILIITGPIWSFLLCVFLCYCFNMIIMRLKGYKLKGRAPVIKKNSFLKRLLYDFPKQLAIDTYNRDPFDFLEHGLHLFCGEQGSGKTTAMVEMIQRWQKRYTKMLVFTNMNYKSEDGQIEHWKDIIKCDNGTYGCSILIDEIQTWFSSNDSKDFPPDMITEISQQRKQRKAIIGTAQVFSRIAKPIREQATYIYLPMTLFGCLTIVRKTKSEWWDNETQKFTKFAGVYFFVHSIKVRDAFDTYKKIERYCELGFTTPAWLTNQNTQTTVKIKK